MKWTPLWLINMPSEPPISQHSNNNNSNNITTIAGAGFIFTCTVQENRVLLIMCCLSIAPMMMNCLKISFLILLCSKVSGVFLQPSFTNIVLLLYGGITLMCNSVTLCNKFSRHLITSGVCVKIYLRNNILLPGMSVCLEPANSFQVFKRHV